MALHDNEEDFRKATICCSFAPEIVRVRRARLRRPVRCCGRLRAGALLPAGEGPAPTRGCAAAGCCSRGAADGAEPLRESEKQCMVDEKQEIQASMITALEHSTQSKTDCMGREQSGNYLRRRAARCLQPSAGCPGATWRPPPPLPPSRSPLHDLRLGLGRRDWFREVGTLLGLPLHPGFRVVSHTNSEFTRWRG